jgi:hypothetical protein
VARPLRPDPARVRRVAAQLVPHLGRMGVVQVYFIFLALISERDGDFSLTAIEVVNQADDCFLHDQAPHSVRSRHFIARSC